MLKFRNPFKNAVSTELQAELETLRQKSRTIDEILAAWDEEYGLIGPGQYVNVDRAMRQSTVWACVRIVAEIIGTLPIVCQQRQGATWVNAEDHQTIELLHQPNEWQTKHDLISFLITWSELRGNGFLFKNTIASGEVRRLLPLEADNVTVKLSDNWKVSYQVSNFSDLREQTAKKIFHLRNFGSEGYKGLSTINNHRNGIGLALQLEDHANAAYKNGLQTNKWVTSEKPIKGEALDKLKAELKKYQGAMNAGKIPIFSGGPKLEESSGVTAADAQYMESRRMQKQEIASIFGVPLFLLNDTEKSTTWGTGLEQLSRAFVKFSLNPRLNRLAQTLQRELVPSSERRSTRYIFDTTEFTLGEFKERMEGYKSGIESGVLNSNEARGIEGMNPREGGDEYRIPLNTAIEGEQPSDEPEDS